MDAYHSLGTHICPVVEGYSAEGRRRVKSLLTHLSVMLLKTTQGSELLKSPLQGRDAAGLLATQSKRRGWEQWEVGGVGGGEGYMAVSR